MLSDWLRNEVTNGTLHEDLVSHGWKLAPNGGQEPQLADLLRHNKTINHVAALPEYQKTIATAEVECA